MDTKNSINKDLSIFDKLTVVKSKNFTGLLTLKNRRQSFVTFNCLFDDMGKYHDDLFQGQIPEKYGKLFSLMLHLQPAFVKPSPLKIPN